MSGASSVISPHAATPCLNRRSNKRTREHARSRASLSVSPPDLSYLGRHITHTHPSPIGDKREASDDQTAQLGQALISHQMCCVCHYSNLKKRRERERERAGELHCTAHEAMRGMSQSCRLLELRNDKQSWRLAFASF
jgi:hypothetical protein